MKPTAKTHEERCLVLASVPRQALVSTITDHVLKENGHYAVPDPEEQNHIHWLQSLVDGRFLCASDDLEWKAGAPGGQGMDHIGNQFVFDMQKERFDAFLTFLAHPMFGQMESDPVLGALKRQPIVATMTVSDPYEAIFRQAILQMIQDDNDTLHRVAAPSQQETKPGAKTTHGMSSKQWNARSDLLCKALCAVCALGQADLVVPLLKLSVAAGDARVPLDMAAFGDHMRIKKSKCTYSVSPAFYATQFSQIDCMKALIAGGLGPNAAVMKEFDKTDKSVRYHDAQMLWNHVVPACSPSAFEVSLEIACTREKPNLELARRVAICTDPKSDFKDLSFYLTAFMNKGHMDMGRTHDTMNEAERKSAATHIRNACYYGFPEVIEHFKGHVPWGDLAPPQTPEQIEDWEEGDRVPGDGDLVYKICEIARQAKPTDDITQALTILLEHALDVGEKNIFKPFSFHNGNNMEPLQTMIDVDMRATMLVYMKAGLEVNEPMRNDMRTPLQHAEIQCMDEMVHMMRSFAARKSVHGLLDDIDNESKSGLAP